MAGKKKLGRVLVKLVSTVGTGTFYVASKNPKRTPSKMQLVKYDPKVNRHVVFTEEKMR